jgi:hypothetical protein
MVTDLVAEPSGKVSDEGVRGEAGRESHDLSFSGGGAYHSDAPGR